MMSTTEEIPEKSSPALVTLVSRIFYYFRPSFQGYTPEKVIISAEEIARVYRYHKETATPAELTVVFEVLKEFGFSVVHIPPQFHLHVANVTKCLEAKDPKKTEDHVKAVIFSPLKKKG